MSGGLYDLSKKDFNRTLDEKRLAPYGDTMNDGKVQLSFTLPVKNDGRGEEAAKLLARKMGLENPHAALKKTLDDGFTFYVIYGSCTHRIDYTAIEAAVYDEAMSMTEIDAFIEARIGRKLVVLGASTGTDAHTVGIDAIMNRKGFAGHYGLERYAMIDAHNMGAQVANADFVRKAVALDADVLLVSQTVTQKDVHIENLTELVELLEAENLRGRFILCCGGARISAELAKELGYDAGFTAGQFAEDAATFFVREFARRNGL